MALGAYQKITRVDASNIFGNGSDGALTISADTTQSLTVKSCSGASGQANLTIASNGFTNGDLVLIHQSRGTGVGQWEINKVSSGGGTTTLTLQENLQYAYTDSGSSQAQVIKILQYTDVTVNSTKTWSASAWNQDTGGFLVFAANGTVTITGSISASQKGFVGGDDTAAGGNGRTGEGDIGASTNPGSSQNPNGTGGGTQYETYAGGGGGGGHANAGSGTPVQGGAGGLAASDATDLSNMVFGGGGGSGNSNDGAEGDGGLSGGIVFIICDDIVITGSISTSGQNGLVVNRGGGGGSGGAVLIEANTATLGTSLVGAAAGAGGDSPNQDGGAGSVGRIALHYGTSYTGTTSPTLSATEDSSLVPAAASTAIVDIIQSGILPFLR